MNKPETKTKRGFASMPAQDLKRIASMGGKAAHDQGRAHQFTRQEAIEAGRKGAASRLKRQEELAKEKK